MNRILPGLTDEQIAALVLRRASKNLRIAQEDAQARQDALREYVNARMASMGLSRDEIEDKHTREVFTRELSRSFRYIETTERRARREQLQAEADALIPPDIKSERWGVGDCGCVVDRIHRGDPAQGQTFAAEPCVAHQGLTLEELHDAIAREVRVRSRTHQFISEQAMPEDGLEFRFEGEGKARRLAVISPSLTAAHETALVVFAEQDLGEKDVLLLAKSEAPRTR